MRDLHTRFRALDNLRAPDLWNEIEERAMAAEPRRTGTNRWLLVTVLALLAVATAGVALVGSGILKLPIVVEASVEPSATADATALASVTVEPTVAESFSPSATPDEAATAQWTMTGAFREARPDSTMTLLLDGTVLATGGYGPIPDLQLMSVELYDPASGSWAITGELVSPHAGHSATLLSDGRVLIAGGGGGGGALTTAELYDPGSESWSATGDMTSGHGGHMATLLQDGRVLVAGGCCDGSGSYLTAAELYDPGSGTWTATGNMVEVRSDATITLLSDGRVLVAGGQSFGVGTAELYDPNTGAWTATASMAAGRIDHTAVLLPDGRVLVAGGYAYDTTGNNGTALASAELYDPSTGTWTTTGSMAEARAGQTATLLSDETVLVAGGQDIRDNAGIDSLATAELYDPVSGTWTPTADMVEARYGHLATLLLDGRVLVVGGGTAASVELYSPVRNP
jgi:hypothetical protein